MIFIDGASLTLEEVISVARFGEQVEISEKAKANVRKSREYIDKLVAEERVVYGITTGFGKFSDVRISREETELLQKNLIMSHCCGTGDLFSEETVRAVMLLRANALSLGYSGIRLETLQALVDLINRRVHPAIPEKGSLGASGDLAPLAHMTLPLLGLGRAFYEGDLIDGGPALEKAGLKPVSLSAKEGLALINGTQVLTAVGAIAAYDAQKLMKLCDIDVFWPHAGHLIGTAGGFAGLLGINIFQITRQGSIRIALYSG